ncbi:DUF4252 domain-containing protein [Cecembia sp.]|uniref:DUF4252 domain-containing protein n=1 Tax=Cecembia sp. TaxID=1898110 RepID=UPI0025C11232|nr:DUF4252 domain-containing protein [Cecembia sp.]
MYLILLFASLMLLTQRSFSQSKSVESLYQKYKGDSEFFHLDLGGSFMNFAKSFDVKLDEGKAQNLANSMERMKIFKLSSGSQSAKSEFQVIKKGLQKEKYDLMMEASDKGGDFMIYTKGSKRIQDVIVLVNDKSGDLIVLELQGDFDSKLLSELGNEIK